MIIHCAQNDSKPLTSDPKTSESLLKFKLPDPIQTLKLNKTYVTPNEKLILTPTQMDTWKVILSLTKNSTGKNIFLLCFSCILGILMFVFYDKIEDFVFNKIKTLDNKIILPIIIVICLVSLFISVDIKASIFIPILVLSFYLIYKSIQQIKNTQLKNGYLFDNEMHIEILLYLTSFVSLIVITLYASSWFIISFVVITLVCYILSNMSKNNELYNKDNDSKAFQEYKIQKLFNAYRIIGNIFLTMTFIPLIFFKIHWIPFILALVSLAVLYGMNKDICIKGYSKLKEQIINFKNLESPKSIN